MSLMTLAVGVLGLLLVLGVGWDVFSVMILTRRATRQFLLTRPLVILLRRAYDGVGNRLSDKTRREGYPSVFGPLFLLIRFAAWALGLVLGFALLQWAAGSEIVASPASFPKVLYASGTTFFTVQLGAGSPRTWLPAVLNVTEAASGLGFLGLVISYLPIFYEDYSQREVRISLLDEWADSPPCAGELLRRLGQDQALEELNPFLKEWEEWSADLLESDLSYPVLAFFRSQHENESWVSALAAILDTCALVLTGIEGIPPRRAHMTFAMARHAAVDISQTLGTGPCEPPVDRLPPPDLARLRTLLASSGVHLAGGSEAESRLAHLRALYEPYVYALSDALFMQLPEWVPDRDGQDNWQRTAKGVDYLPGISG